MAVAVGLLDHGVPCLRLFRGHKAADGSDVYELFADIFTVLQVRIPPSQRSVGMSVSYTSMPAACRYALFEQRPCCFARSQQMFTGEMGQLAVV